MQIDKCATIAAHIQIYCTVLDIGCGPYPVVRHGITDGSTTTYNSTVHYTCDANYRLEYGYQTMTIQCEEDGHWTHGQLTCDRKLQI